MRVLLFLAVFMVNAAMAADKPDFTLPDLEGKPVSLSDFRGKWVIVNYWATWCPPCLEEIPDLVDLYENNRDTLVVLGVDHEEVSLDYLKEFADTHFMSYPVLQMEPLPVSPLGPIMGLPTTYIVSPDGTLMARQEGPVTREDVEKYIQRKQARAEPASVTR